MLSRGNSWLCGNSEPFSTGLGLLVILLLVALLVEKELIRALGGWRSSR
jgi:hypothetical protein